MAQRLKMGVEGFRRRAIRTQHQVQSQALKGPEYPAFSRDNDCSRPKSYHTVARDSEPASGSSQAGKTGERPSQGHQASRYFGHRPSIIDHRVRTLNKTYRAYSVDSHVTKVHYSVAKTFSFDPRRGTDSGWIRWPFCKYKKVNGTAAPCRLLDWLTGHSLYKVPAALQQTRESGTLHAV